MCPAITKTTPTEMSVKIIKEPNHSQSHITMTAQLTTTTTTITTTTKTTMTMTTTTTTTTARQAISARKTTTRRK